jgi:hypothetical protein
MPSQIAAGAASIGGFGGAGGNGGQGASGASGSLSTATAGAGPDVSPGEGAGTLEFRCGDGQVDAGEKCDTGIRSGMPGACPSTCGAAAACQRVMLFGTDCQTECKVATLGCAAGDHCCPANCDAAQDPDCSGMCGDGIVQAELGETCEDSDPEERCPTLEDCADDDPCTRDALSGSKENCNAVCTRAPITSLTNNDGCCPPAATANTDNDCMARCGNGLREADEECDGSTGCDSTCKLTLTQTQVTCLDTFGKSDCERCTCMQCTDAMLACRASGIEARDASCAAVENCAIEKMCSSSPCYCGDVPFYQCGLASNGPCKSVIEDAANSMSVTVIESQRQDGNTALGRADVLATCRRMQCRKECG